MVSYRYPLIAREGWRIITVVSMLGLVIHIWFSALFAIPFWLTAIFLCFLFRDPARAVPPKPLAIVSPVDGKITAISHFKDPYIDREVLMIQLSMGLFDVFSTRSPMEGKVMKQWFGEKGFGDKGFGEKKLAEMGSTEKKFDVNNSEANNISGVDQAKGSEDERCETIDFGTSRPKPCRFAQWIQSDEQDDIVMAVKPSAKWFRPLCYAHSGERVGQGQRCGIIPFGALVEISVPENSRLNVKVGDQVRAGSDTIATLVH